MWHNLFRVKTDGRFCCLGTGDNPAPSVGCFHKLVRLGLSFTLWFTCLAIPHSGLSAWIVLWTCHLGISWYLDLVPGLLSGLFTCSSPAGEISFRPVCPPRATCMVEDLALVVERLDLLSSQVAELTEAVNRLTVAQSTSAPPSSYEVVRPFAATPAPSSPRSRVGSTTSSIYNDLATEIPPVPDFVLRSCAQLSGGRFTSRQRAERAWTCGWWARFCWRDAWPDLGHHSH